VYPQVKSFILSHQPKAEPAPVAKAVSVAAAPAAKPTRKVAAAPVKRAPVATKTVAANKSAKSKASTKK